MQDYRFIALDRAGKVGSFPLKPTDSGEAVLSLTTLRGSGGLHLEVRDAEQAVRLRGEIPGADGETLEVKLTGQDDQVFALDAGGRPAVVLPADERYRPLAPIDPPRKGQPWDLAIVVDGTARIRDDSGVGRPLLDDPEVWSAVAGRLATLVTELDKDGGGATWVTVLAFGDEPIKGVSDPGLCPSYLLHWGLGGGPHGLVPLARVDLVGALEDLPATSGGDFTDALGDALYACTALHWRAGSRRLAVVVGDSPGHSLTAPVPRGGDARARQHDVDMEARRLHRLGVEILTLYLPPPRPGSKPVAPFANQKRELLRHAADQYLRLASEASLAVTSDGFDPAALAGLLLTRDYPLARGPSYGLAGAD